MCIAAAAGRLPGGARVPTLDRMRETFRVALVALALSAAAAIGCRTSALQPLRQTSGTTNDLPGTTQPPITLPSPTIPGQSTPQPTIPTTPQVAGTTSFLDGGSLLGVTGGAGLPTPGTPTYAMPDTSAYDAGFSPGLAAPGPTGIGGAGTYGFSPDGGAF